MGGNDDGLRVGAGMMLGGGVGWVEAVDVGWEWGGGWPRRGLWVREVVMEGRGGGCRCLCFRVGMAASFAFISLPTASLCEFDRTDYAAG